MAVATINTEDIFLKCLPRMDLGTVKCQGLSMMDIATITEEDLNSIYTNGEGNYRVFGALIEADIIGKACQTRQYALYDWVIGTARAWGSKRLTFSPINQGLYEIYPFIKMKRKGIINVNYWNAVGTNSGGTAPNGVAYTSRFDLTSNTNIPVDVRWFPARTELYVSGKSVAGSATKTHWHVVDSAISGNAVRVYVTSVNADSSLDSDKLEFPLVGLATRGVANVSQWESYCTQIPGINPDQLALFWLQETRWSICVDEEVEKLLEYLRLNNKLYATFGDVPTVELNRQITEDFQRRLVETFFWNKPLPNQNANDFESLEVITTATGESITDYISLPGLQGRAMARRANAVGVYEQLAECGRVFDLQSRTLNIPELLGQLYLIKRTRESNGINTNMIELVVASSYAFKLKQGFFRYMNSRLEGAFRVTADLKDISKTLPNGLSFTDFQVDYPEGLTVRIVTHSAFDDLLDAHQTANAGLANVGRTMLILDMPNTIYMATIETAKVTNQTGDLATQAALNETMLCVMKTIRKKVTMGSMLFTIVVECPGASMWVENIGDAVPEHCAPVDDVEDMKGEEVA